jgi:hypothetical protein
VKLFPKLAIGVAAAALASTAAFATSPFTQTQWVWGVTSAMTGTTSTQVIAAVANKSIYVTRFHCNNSSGTATLVNVQDGSAGTTLDTLSASATYGGDNQSGGVLFITTNGNGLYAVDATTGASVICAASGYAN